MTLKFILDGPEPPPLRLEPDPGDFERLALHALLILSDAKERVCALVADAALNSHEIDDLLASIDAHLSDVGDDVSGALHKAADRLRDDRYNGIISRGPFVRVRR